MVAVGAWLPYSLRAGASGLTPLSPLYWVLLIRMLLCFMLLTKVVKAGLSPVWRVKLFIPNKQRVSYR